jgi:class 3 adenylate cyclase/Tfp pilus assembly protein PilF
LRYSLLIVFFIAIAIFTPPLQSQNREQAKLELLNEKLKTAVEDTNKVTLLQLMSFQYNSLDPELGIKYGNQSLTLAKKLGWQKGIAKSYNSIGGNLFALGDFDEALDYFQKSLKLNEESKDSSEIAKNLTNIGNIYYNLSNFSIALNYYQKALKIDIEIDDKEGEADNNGNIGNIYSDLTNYKSALKYYSKALKIHEKINNRRGIATILGNMGTAYLDSKQYDKALTNFSKALELWELFGNKFGIATNLGNIANTYNYLSDYQLAITNYEKALAINEEIGNKFGSAAIMGNMGGLYYNLTRDTVISRLKEKNSIIHLDKEYNIERSIKYSEKATELAESIGSRDMLSEFYGYLEKAYALKGDFKRAYSYQREWIELRDSIFSVQKTKEIAKLEATKQGELNEKEIKLRDLELTRKNNEQYVLFLGFGGAAIMLLLVFFERRKSEKLLLNILPAKIAKRLKNNEKRIADRFENTAIIFLDIVGFTSFSKDTDPVKVVSVLNEIFTHFDSLTKEHGLEKIKTIGDCYMAAAGLPEPHPQPILSTAEFALDAQRLMQDYTTKDGHKLHFRIGIDAGPVVAGVIGERKFSYDLWGDAVNTASRMESTGLPNEIQVTENFAKSLAGYNITCEERGEINIKGKGIIKTYLLKDHPNRIKRSGK